MTGQGPQFFLSIPEEREKTWTRGERETLPRGRGGCQLWLFVVCMLFGSNNSPAISIAVF